jgi:rubrerythrin
MKHYFSTYIDSEVYRCEHCGVNVLSPNASDPCPNTFITKGN